MKNNLVNNQKTLLTRIWQPLVVTGAVVLIPMGVGNFAPTTAIAQSVPPEISASWGETISLTSILTGYESIVLGWEEIGINEEVNISDSFITFSDTIAAFSLSGTVGNTELTLNGQGFLSGDVGAGDLSWTGNWLGNLGNEFITADDSAIFSFDASDGYTQLDFQQFGFKDFDMWDATTTAILTSGTSGGLVSGWSGQGAGIGGSVSSVLADLETEFFLSGNAIDSSLTIDGVAQSYIVALDDSSIVTEGNYSCEENKSCQKTSIDEPSPLGGLLFLLALGVFRRVFKSKVRIFK